MARLVRGGAECHQGAAGSTGGSRRYGRHRLKRAGPEGRRKGRVVAAGL